MAIFEYINRRKIFKEDLEAFLNNWKKGSELNDRNRTVLSTSNRRYDGSD